MKSKCDRTDKIAFGEGLDVTPLDLESLVAQAGDRKPVLAISRPNEITTGLADACADANIDVEWFDLVR